MVQELQDLIEILNKQVRFYYTGTQTENELSINVKEVLNMYFEIINRHK